MASLADHAKRALRFDQLAYRPALHAPVHPTRWEFPAYLDNPACSWLQALRALYAQPITFPASLSTEAGLLLHALVRNARPRIVIETGTFVGVSTLWIAGALRENGDSGRVHSFDTFGPIHRAAFRDVEMPSGRFEFVAARVDEADVREQVVFHAGDSAEQIAKCRDELRDAGGAQLAFIDGDHSVEGAWRDLIAIEPLVPTGGLVLLHDTFPDYSGHDGPRHVLDHLDERAAGVYERVEVHLAPVNYGMALLRRIG